jgi:hypothetical protein
MTLAVMGYHFQVITRRLSKALDAAVAPKSQDATGSNLPAGSGGQTR